VLSPLSILTTSKWGSAKCQASQAQATGPTTRPGFSGASRPAHGYVRAAAKLVIWELVVRGLGAYHISHHLKGSPSTGPNPEAFLDTKWLHQNNKQQTTDCTPDSQRALGTAVAVGCVGAANALAPDSELVSAARMHFPPDKSPP
jgi:hypothetical protein